MGVTMATEDEMETSFGYFETSLACIPLPIRRIFILASRKLMGGTRDHRLLDAYAAELVELYLDRVAGEMRKVDALEMCIDAYGRTLAGKSRELVG